MEKKGKMLIAILIVATILGAGLYVILWSDEDESATLVDAEGRKVTIDSKPETIVSVSPAITEMIYAFGKGDCLKGVTTYCDYPSEVVDGVANGTIKTVGGYYYDIDVEKIISMNPDVVFLEQSVSEQLSAAETLEDAGINAVVLYTADNSTYVYKNIELIGKALFEESTASALESSLKSKFDEIQTKVASSNEKPKVMLVIWWDSTSIYVAADGTFADEIIESAGGVNAFDYKSSWASVNSEDVLAADPDIIILCAMSMGDVDQALSELNDNTVYDDINATVYTLLGQADNAFLRQSVRIVDAAYICAMMCHPDLFNEVLLHDLGDNYTEYLPAAWASS